MTGTLIYVQWKCQMYNILEKSFIVKMINIYLSYDLVVLFLDR